MNSGPGTVRPVTGTSDGSPAHLCRFALLAHAPQWRVWAIVSPTLQHCLPLDHTLLHSGAVQMKTKQMFVFLIRCFVLVNLFDEVLLFDLIAMSG